MTELRRDGAVPPPMSKLMLALLDGKTRPAGDGHRGARVLTDKFQLSPGQRMYGRSQEQIRLGAEWIRRHHLTRVCQIPATSMEVIQLQ